MESAVNVYRPLRTYSSHSSPFLLLSNQVMVILRRMDPASRMCRGFNTGNITAEKQECRQVGTTIPVFDWSFPDHETPITEQKPSILPFNFSRVLAGNCELIPLYNIHMKPQRSWLKCRSKKENLQKQHIN
jgi:hypothetical protein